MISSFRCGGGDYSTRFFGLGWMFGLTHFDGGADGAEVGLIFVVFGVFALFVLRVNKWVVAVFAVKDFVGHIAILYLKSQGISLGLCMFIDLVEES